MAKNQDVDVRHYDVILSPHITEKATLLSENNAVVFKVAAYDATYGLCGKAAARQKTCLACALASLASVRRIYKLEAAKVFK